MKQIRFGVIGYGSRGKSIVKNILLKMEDVCITSVCDLYSDRVESAQKAVEAVCGKQPFGTTDYRELLNCSDLDAVYIASDWESHVEIAIDAMEKGIPVALEVGGAYRLEPLWEMVNTQEKTGTPLMLMENCCFNRTELLATSIVRHGVLGEIVHCHGCYGHDLRDLMADGEYNHHYRLKHYRERNSENYPTHELGPIAKLLNINRGNQMLSLVSVASKARGMEDFLNRNSDKYPELVGMTFTQGDIVNTLITCADGTTVSLRLDTTLPRSYAREFNVHGTKGLYEQNCNLVFLDGEKETFHTEQYYKENIGNAQAYEEKYLPPIWKAITPEQLKAGHGGMDYVEFRVFVDCLKENRAMPIDVYDAAAWMCVTALSAASIAAGGAPQSIPDFTRGKWMSREPMDVIELE